MQCAAKKRRHGISLASPPALDVPELLRWKEGIVNKLSNGVAALCKRASILLNSCPSRTIAGYVLRGSVSRRTPRSPLMRDWTAAATPTIMPSATPAARRPGGAPVTRGRRS